MLVPYRPLAVSDASRRALPPDEASMRPWKPGQLPFTAAQHQIYSLQGLQSNYGPHTRVQTRQSLALILLICCTRGTTCSGLRDGAKAARPPNTKEEPSLACSKTRVQTRRRRSALKATRWPALAPCSRRNSTSIRCGNPRRPGRHRTARPTRAIGTAKTSEAEAPSTLLGPQHTCLVV